MNGYCPKCGTALRENGRFCPGCGHDLGSTADDMIQQTNISAPGRSPAAAVLSAVRGFAAKIVRKLPLDGAGGYGGNASIAPQVLVGSIRADAQSGESSFEISELPSAVPQTLLGRLPVAGILTGLGAGGISCAALWNTEHPMVISLVISAAILGGKFAYNKLRGRRAQK